MRKFLVMTTLLLGALTAQAQEKVMNIQKTDGTCSQTRVADLEQISFLAADAGEEGLLVKTAGGATTAVLFTANPVVTVADGRLVVKSTTADAIEIEINDITEICFGKATGDTSVTLPRDFDCVVQDGGLLLRNIPAGVTAHIYTLDGRSLPVPLVRSGELLVNRTTVGSSIYIVKVGSFSTKIQL